MFLYLVELPRKIKTLILSATDLVALIVALWSAVALRLGTFSPNIATFHWLFVVVPVGTVIIFNYIGLYRSILRYTNDKVISTIAYGGVLSVLFLSAIVTFGRYVSFPRSSIVIYWAVLVLLISISRYFAKLMLSSFTRVADKKKRVAIYGAGRAGFQAALSLISGPEYKPVAFFDDDVSLHGTVIAGIRVYNPKKALEIMELKQCKQLLLAMPSAPRARRRDIIQVYEGKDIVLKTLPGIGDIVGGKVRIEDIREVGIDDLLGRDAVPPHEELISSCIQGKSVMVTGAGGSIGSELCRQILKHKPSRLILFEQNEYNLYKIEGELIKNNQTPLFPILGDVTNQNSAEAIIEQHKVETIYHAAAYKHVPLVEANIIAGVVNNVFGTFSIARAAIAQNVKNFVLISTDKAVRPTNVMGASKRLAELILQGLAQQKNLKTCFAMVRFGNVLGSSGSVVPLFSEQIRNGGPVTVTHPDVTRFFMTIPEAAQLVIQAGAMATGGEVFVLDMGESIKIVDLARKMIEFSGFAVYDSAKKLGDIEIIFSGLRPGEKLYEELLLGNNVKWTAHPRIMRAEEKSIELSDLMAHLEELEMQCRLGETKAVKTALQKFVPEYQVSKN